MTVIRPFRKEDVPQVLALMRALADFEGYLDAFRVTEADLIRHGLGSAPRFGVFVAEQMGRVAGIAVHYTIPWTFDLKPTLILKELYVADSARGQGLARALFERLQQYACEIGASRISWTVLVGNTGAERFYERVGGLPDVKWRPWTMPMPDCGP